MTTIDHTKTGLDEHLSYLKLVYMTLIKQMERTFAEKSGG
jgi:hypothetical protein